MANLGASQVALAVNNPPAKSGVVRDAGLIPGLGRSPGGVQPTPAFLTEESHEERNLVGYNLWGHKELDMVKQFTSHAQMCHLGKILITSCIFHIPNHNMLLH